MKDIEPVGKSQTPLKKALSLWPFIRKGKKRLIYIYGLLSVISVFTELISVGALAPFIVVFLQPEKLLANSAIKAMVEYFNIVQVADLQLCLFLIFVAGVAVSGTIKLALAWFQSRLSYGIAADLAAQIFSSAMHRSFEYHQRVNSSAIVSTIANKANIVADNLVHPMLSFLLALITISAFSIFLLVLNPLVTGVVVSLISLSYLTVSTLVRKKVSLASKVINENFDSVMKLVSEALEGIRYVMLTGTHKIFINAHAKIEQDLRVAQANVAFASLFPRAVIESLALILVASILYLFTRENPDLDRSLGLIAFLGVLALSLQKLLPIAQQAYAGWTKLSGSADIIDDTLSRLSPVTHTQRSLMITKPKLKFNDRISLCDVSFGYGNIDQAPVLQRVNLEINRGSKVGLTGPSGSGKSTLIDLIMGFLTPASGKILVDGTRIIDEKNVEEWQANISLVPQHIYLTDSSILSNIAFGVTPNKIDFERINKILKITLLEDFLQSLADGLEYRVGERGKNLSHGQKQRIGIARALYRDSDLLVIDEGTSALDARTQAEIVKNLSMLDSSPAIIMIAHRTEVFAGYDAIYEVRNRTVAEVTA